MAVTPNRGLTIINGATDLLSAGDDVINANSTILDKATVLLQGTMAARPAQPHPVGVLFQPSDVSGYLYLSTGSAWLEVAPGAGASPIGSMADWAGVGDAAGGTWLLCDGRSLLRTDYNLLFNALGGVASPWGLPDSSTFSLPDFRGRVTVGQDNAGTSMGAANRLPNSLRARGQASGEERHGLLATEHAAHSHTGTTAIENSSLAHSHTIQFSQQVAGSGSGGLLGGTFGNTGSNAGVTQIGGPPAHTHNFTTADQGSGTPFNVMQPYAVANKIIRCL